MDQYCSVLYMYLYCSVLYMYPYCSVLYMYCSILCIYLYCSVLCMYLYCSVLYLVCDLSSCSQWVTPHYQPWSLCYQTTPFLNLPR